MTAYELRISDWSSDVCSSDLKVTTLCFFEVFLPSSDAYTSFNLPSILAHQLNKRRDGFGCVHQAAITGSKRLYVVLDEVAGPLQTFKCLNEICIAGQHHGFARADRSEEPTSELQSLMRISYDVFCLKQHKTYY